MSEDTKEIIDAVLGAVAVTLVCAMVLFASYIFQ